MAVKILSIGASNSQICGVRDYSAVIGSALAEEGAETRTLWLELSPAGSTGKALFSTREWLAGVRHETALFRPDWVFWHYSPVTYGWHGLPFLQPLVIRQLSGRRTRVLGVMHEYAHDFGTRGWRGDMLAATQRAALRMVVAACDRLLVTTERRKDWFETRRWLPHRPTLFAPVPSSFPEVDLSPSRNGEFRIGVLGFGGESVDPHATLRAVAELRREGVPAHLVLIGSPGGFGNRWLQAAETRRISEAVEVTGVLEPRAVATAAASSDLLVFPNLGGATPRKTTLAASLASGRPVIALDGPETWEALRTERVLSLVDGARLEDRIREFARSADLRDELGRRGRDFYQRRMAPRVIARLLLDGLGA
jgi:glycosyltransferase involved in cell wall biosynthesis